LEFYQSRNIEQVRRRDNDCLSIYVDCADNRRLNDCSEYTECRHEYEELVASMLTREHSQEGLTDKALWEKINTDKIAKFREVYMDYNGENRKPNYTLNLWRKSVSGVVFSHRLLLALGLGQELPQDAFYDFERIAVIDNMVYPLIDGIGVIPGADTFTDPIGAVYSSLRGNIKDATIYTASTVFIGVSATHVKQIENFVGVIAHQTDDGIELAYKQLDKITPTDFVVTRSAIEGKTDLNILKQNFDEKAFKTQLDELGKISKDISQKAKDLLKTARGSATKFATDKRVIEKVSEFLNNPKALNTIGGEQGLQDIIRANMRAGCGDCGKATTKFLKNMDEYLDDVLDFAKKYENTEGFSDVIKELKKINKNDTPNFSVEGATFMLDRMRKTPEINPQTVKKFDGKFDGGIDNICENCRFDIELTDGNRYEFKSWGDFSINEISKNKNFLKQHLTYLSQTEDLSKLHYIFDAKKFDDRGKIIEQFKEMYLKNAEDIFEANQNLFKTYDRVGGGKIRNLSDFKVLLKNNEANHSMFNFIKAL
ncbi:hypothetical protein, partial [Capnocytophaga stomatis]